MSDTVNNQSYLSYNVQQFVETIIIEAHRRQINWV